MKQEKFIEPVNTKAHTDIKRYEWIDKFLPDPVHPYVYLARLDRPIGIWLLLLPGWWAIVLAAGGIASMNMTDWRLMALFGVGAVVMRSAGCVINDLWDRKIDQKVQRTQNRPLASGEVSPGQAIAFLTGLLLVGLFILLQMNITTVLLGVLTIPFIVTYPLMKRFTWWPQAFLGITFNFGALMGWAAVSGIVSLDAFFLYLAGIFWTLGYDTIYAHQDKEDDLLAGIKSTALKFGENSKKWVTGFYGLALVCLLKVFIGAFTIWLVPVFILPLALHFYWQLKSWNPEDAGSSLKIFRANRDFGLLVLIAACLS